MITKNISNYEAISFLKKNHASREVVFIRDHDEWFGAYEDGVLISVTGISFKKGTITFGGTYTVKEYRRRGACMKIRMDIFNKYPHADYVSYARPKTAEMLQKYFGFQCVQEFNNGTKKMVRKHGKTENRD